MLAKLPPFSPLKAVHLLLIHPEFSQFSFWNYKDSAALIGAQSPSPPLGLLTVAALVPKSWQVRVIDLNTDELREEDWQWADIVGVGGMLPQQTGILAVMRSAKARQKFVLVGGPDPSSQPDLYGDADALILGEGEITIPLWLESWQQGSGRGIFQSDEKPDVTQSPCPRFDLVDLKKYVQVGIQYSRGCPFNCEFCDIIELYGRKPRTKTPAQILHELDTLYELGYSGSIDLVDDNFIGNKRAVKRELLPALIAWQKAHRFPFYFCTEASMNMADDHPLMAAMQEADFRVIFMGIETPDEKTLLATQKSQNTTRPIAERVRTLYRYGMVVTAGFILGFDGETSGTGDKLEILIEECGINMAMVGLLVALPGTQLTRRLIKEKRLLTFAGKPLTSAADAASNANSLMEVVDQTLAGLNFVTTRDRLEILSEYSTLVKNIYRPRAYFDRVLQTCLQLTMHSKHLPRRFELRRALRGLVRTSWQMTREPHLRRLYWRNVWQLARRGRHVFEQGMRLMGIFLHFEKQVAYVTEVMETQKVRQEFIPRAVTRGEVAQPQGLVAQFS